MLIMANGTSHDPKQNRQSGKNCVQELLLKYHDTPRLRLKIFQIVNVRGVANTERFTGSFGFNYNVRCGITMYLYF